MSLPQAKVLYTIMHDVFSDEVLTCHSDSLQNRRLFTPVILFNDHTPGAGRRNNDGGHYSVSPERASPGGSLMEHKKRIDEMLEANGKFWADVTASYLQGLNGCILFSCPRLTFIHRQWKEGWIPYWEYKCLRW